MVEPTNCPATEELLSFFECDHLPDHLANVSRRFQVAAHGIASTLEPSRERTVSLRKLLEAKDAGVRAALLDARKEGPSDE